MNSITFEVGHHDTEDSSTAIESIITKGYDESINYDSFSFNPYKLLAFGRQGKVLHFVLEDIDSLHVTYVEETEAINVFNILANIGKEKSIPESKPRLLEQI